MLSHLLVELDDNDGAHDELDGTGEDKQNTRLYSNNTGICICNVSCGCVGLRVDRVEGAGSRGGGGETVRWSHVRHAHGRYS